MKMFLLGMLIMYVAMNLAVWIADLINEEYAMRRTVPLFYLLSEFFCELLPKWFHLIPYFPLCVRYKMNPFSITLLDVCNKLDTEQARAEWLAKTYNKNVKYNWEKLFKQHPVNEVK